MKTVIFTNQKGGVGKTTLCRNIGWELATCGYKILLIDADGQGNLTKSFTDLETPGLYEALTGSGIHFQNIRENLDLLSGSKKLSLLEKQLASEIDGYTRLSELLGTLDFEPYDLVFIDSPPSLGMLTANGLAASSYLVIPMNASLFSMQGTNDLLETVGKVVKTFNPELSLLGVVINTFEVVPVISRQIAGEIIESFGEIMFKTIIHKSIKIEEAVALQCGVSELSGSGTQKVKSEIESLASELKMRLGLKQPSMGVAGEPSEVLNHARG
jgi:chromosome partitioning protein